MKAVDMGRALANAVQRETPAERLEALLSLLNAAQVFGTQIMATAVCREARQALQQ